MKYSEYIDVVVETNRLPAEDITPLLFGLFGEVGGLLTATKKRYREESAYTEFSSDFIEEAGDSIWYFVSIFLTLGVKKIELVDWLENTKPENTANLDAELLKLADKTNELISVILNNGDFRVSGKRFLKKYVNIIDASGNRVLDVIDTNYSKIIGRFIKPKFEDLEKFDSAFDIDEQLPEYFEITVSEKANGKSYLKWRDVFIGDPLTDSIKDKDYYRFHDVFHFSNAAILHWSPTFRTLIKHKRKSCPLTEEAEDSGRAVVVEEGLSAWLFAYANTPEVALFENHSSISFNVLKTIEQFTRGYEVNRCPLYLWEKAILDGYRVFRQLKANKGGIIVGNRNTRTIEYKSLS